MIERIINNNILLAIIIRIEFQKDGIEFFTDGHFSQQLGYMKRPANYIIEPHTHNPVVREIIWTQEVLFIKSGKVRVDFYTDEKIYIESRILYTGDVILLAHGGHGFEIIEEAEIIEVKQGPFCGDQDKTRFSSIDKSKIKFSKE
jgi:hypothetical protein